MHIYRKFLCYSRSFRSEWCDKFPWLHYSVELDAAFCHLCMQASFEGKFLTSTKRDPSFITKGFTYWKEATTAFRKHLQSECHKEATEALISLPQSIKGSIGEILNEEIKEEKEMNRKSFLVILQNISFLARQGLPLRGHGDIESNFHQLLLLRGIECNYITPWLNKKTNKYTSHEIQNECLKLLSVQLLRELNKKIQKSACYSIMADECTDASNKEQFTICMRWVDEELQDHEDFIGLYQVDSINSSALTDAIKDVLIRMDLTMLKCRGQCYDGAANMSGSRNGVAAQLLAEENRAIYTHCYGHALNLAVGTTLKQSKVCRDAMDVAFEVAKLIKFSPKRDSIFQKIKADEADEEDRISRIGIRSFCPTRWTVRGVSVASILENYNILQRLWDECLKGTLVPDVKGRIIGVKAQMAQFKMLFGLQLSKRILVITDNLSKTLQHESMSAAEAQVIVSKTIETLKNIRGDDMFQLFWKHTELLREHTGIDEPILPRKRRAPSRYEIGDGEGFHLSIVEDHYRLLYFEAIDLAIMSIQDRFNQSGFLMYQNLEELLIKAANSKDYSSEMEKVVSFYGDDFESKEQLSTQLEIFSSSFNKDSSNHVTLREAIKCVQDFSPGQRAYYSQICKVVQLILVMPATNAASERSFSTMKRVKSYLRSTMGQERLNNLMIMNIYKTEAEKLDLKLVADEFVCGSEH